VRLRRRGPGARPVARRRCGAPAAAAALAAVTLCGCGWVRESLTRPEPEPAVDASHGYLAKGGVQAELDLGPDQKLLLAEFSNVQTAKINLETRLAELEGDNESLRAQLKQAEAARAAEQGQRTTAEAELQRLRGLIRERDAKVLGLSIEKAKQQQELLLFRISALEKQVETQKKAANAGAGRAEDQ
jgi:hypothetical protein